MNSFVLPVDKPSGPTSHDIVAIARRALGTRRIGHTGTLDPFASGLLLLCVNNATRIAEYLTRLPKRYRATACFNGMTSTDDVTGDMLSISDGWRALNQAQVRAAFATQTGTVLQRPSMYSAKKIAGERAYDLARRGEAVDLSPVEVTIYDIRILSVELPDVSFVVDCSSGTYVRAIARDVGAILGTGGYLKELRRTRIGEFDVSQAVAPEFIADGKRIPVRAALGHMPHVEINETEERVIRFGQKLMRATTAGTVALVSGDELVAIAESDGELLRPRKVFPRD